MLRIAICDDDQESRERLYTFAQDFPFENTCELFASGEALLEAFQEEHDKGMAYQVAFLDLQLGGAMSGIDVANAIRSISPDTIIIFVTGYPKFITKILKIRPDQVLIKPIDREEFLDTMAFVLTEQKQKESQVTFTFKLLKGQYAVFKLDEICYLEAQGHYIEIHNTKGPAVMAPGSLSMEEKRFLPYNFVKVHRSYLVNLAHIKHIDGCALTVATGTVIQMSKRYSGEVSDRYIEYLSKTM